MNSKRTITNFSHDERALETVMAHTYGHTIPLNVQVVDDQQLALVIDNTVPDTLVEQAKQICHEGYRRYHNRQL